MKGRPNECSECSEQTSSHNTTSRILGTRAVGYEEVRRYVLPMQESIAACGQQWVSSSVDGWTDGRGYACVVLPGAIFSRRSRSTKQPQQSPYVWVQQRQPTKGAMAGFIDWSIRCQSPHLQQPMKQAILSVRNLVSTVVHIIAGAISSTEVPRMICRSVDGQIINPRKKRKKKKSLITWFI